MATLAAVVAVAAAGYWWLNRPPHDWKRDNSGLYPIKVDGKFGFMDRSGKTVIPPQFDATDGFSEGLASVRIGTKAGYINTKGTLVITPQFDAGRAFVNGRAGVQLANQYGFIDTEGKIICTPTFRWVGAFFGDGKLAPVGFADNQVAFVDRSGTLVLSGKFEAASPWGFTEGLAPAKSGGKWGYIDGKGTWVIEPQFEEASNFREGLAPVTVGGRIGYIDQKGKFVINPQFEAGEGFSEGRASVRTGDRRGFIDRKGGVVGNAKFLDTRPFRDGLAPVRTKDGWGYIDATGKLIVSPQFESAQMFQNGLSLVTVAGKEAYVTTTGAFVVDPLPNRAGQGGRSAEDLSGGVALTILREHKAEAIPENWNWSIDLPLQGTISDNSPRAHKEHGSDAEYWEINARQQLYRNFLEYLTDPQQFAHMPAFLKYNRETGGILTRLGAEPGSDYSSVYAYRLKTPTQDKNITLNGNAGLAKEGILAGKSWKLDYMHVVLARMDFGAVTGIQGLQVGKSVREVRVQLVFVPTSTFEAWDELVRAQRMADLLWPSMKPIPPTTKEAWEAPYAPDAGWPTREDMSKSKPIHKYTFEKSDNGWRLSGSQKSLS